MHAALDELEVPRVLDPERLVRARDPDDVEPEGERLLAHQPVVRRSLRARLPCGTMGLALAHDVD